MTDYINKVVIMEHPLMYDRHLIAKVISQSKMKVRVQYWDVRTQAWNNDPKGSLRDQKRIRILGDVDHISNAEVQKTAEKLISLYDKLNDSVREIRKTYFESVRNISIFKEKGI